MKANIFICGPSGTGKSSSLRNLNPDTTAIINTEQKALPFRGASKFKKNVNTPSLKEFNKVLEKALAPDNGIEVIVIESFTALTETIYRDFSKIYKGFDLWGEYNKEIDRILHLSKTSNKYVAFLGIDEFVDDENDGVSERYIKVQGKAWRKSVEKEFVIVAYTNVTINENGKPEYSFITNKCQGHTSISAKSPMDMLPETMNNDLAKMIELIENYYQ